MGRITSGISQIGGKFRLLNTILKYIPYHEFYLEPFLGSAIVLLNKPRCRYECGNDLNSEMINYLLTIREYPQEFDQLKQGVFGLVSQEICNRIVRGELLPKNNIERAYFFYYLNKLTFGGSVQKGYGYLINGSSGMGLVNPCAIPQDFETIKCNYRGINTMEVPRKNEVEEIKSTYRGITPKSPNFGLINTSRCSQSGKGRVDKNEVDKAKNNYKNAMIKGINPKTTRPYTNNDCGLLSPLNPKAIKRLRYVNLTCYPFDKVYNMFYQAFHVRKGLGPECFIYLDPPYPGTEKYYKSGFGQEEHDKLITIMKESPFHMLLSIGGECEQYLEELENMIIVTVKVKYSTDANSQTDKQEYLIMNYDIEELPLMTYSIEQNTMEEWI